MYTIGIGLVAIYRANGSNIEQYRRFLNKIVQIRSRESLSIPTVDKFNRVPGRLLKNAIFLRCGLQNLSGNRMHFHYVRAGKKCGAILYKCYELDFFSSVCSINS